MKSRNLLPLGILIFLLGLLGMTTRLMNSTKAPSEAEQEAQKAQDEAKTVAEKVNDAPVREDTPPEVTEGVPEKAAMIVRVGWNYDVNSLSNPIAILNALSMIQQYVGSSRGRVAMQMVDVDLPDEARSEGARQVKDLGVTLVGTPFGDKSRVLHLDGNLGTGKVSSSALFDVLGKRPYSYQFLSKDAKVPVPL